MGEKVSLHPDIARPDIARPDVGQAPSRRRSRAGLIVVLLLLVIGGVLAWRLLGPAPQHPAGRSAGLGAPQTVGVATIGTGDMDMVLQGLGAVTPIATVTVRTQINGQLQELAFQEGQIVHKGDFLAQIDPRPYQVALEQAQGTLAHDTALLHQAEADNARYQQLNRQDSISRQQAQDQVFLIKQYQGSIISDQAAVDSAKLNLTYCHIVSPVDGRVGIRMVDQGNYVQTSDTSGIVVVTQLQPMSVLFTLPEDNVGEVQRQMQKGPLAVTAYDRTDTTLIATGTLATTDNEIDPTTGTVKLRALFPNTDNALFPQQFVNAHLLVETLHDVVIAPIAVVQHGAPGAFVYLVKPDDTVSVQVVKTGISQGERVQITDGLQAGDRVVVDGLDRLRDGMHVSVVAPTPPGAAAPAGPARPHGRHAHRKAPAGGTPTAAPSTSDSG